MKNTMQKAYQAPQCRFEAVEEQDVIRTSPIDPWNPELEDDLLE